MQHRIQRAVFGAAVALLGALWGFPSVGLAFGASSVGTTASDAQSGAATGHAVAVPLAPGADQDGLWELDVTGLALPKAVPVDRRDDPTAPAAADVPLERAPTGEDSGLARAQALSSGSPPESNDPAADADRAGQVDTTDRRGEAGGDSTGAPDSEASVAPPRPARTVHVDGLVEDPWEAVRWCESRDRYDINTGNGFYGAYQFTIVTWDWVAGLTDRDDLVGVRPDLADPADQDFMAEALAFDIPGGGLGHWPVCGAYYGT